MSRQPYWCWYHQQPRADCGGADGSCPAVEAEAAAYRVDLEEGRVKTLFQVTRLARERESGVSSNDIGKEIVESAKAEGREIESVKGYGG